MRRPKELLLIRHAESAYNESKQAQEAMRSVGDSARCLKMIVPILNCTPLPAAYTSATRLNTDRDTPITSTGEEQARITGLRTRESGEVPMLFSFLLTFVRNKPCAFCGNMARTASGDCLSGGENPREGSWTGASLQ